MTMPRILHLRRRLAAVVIAAVLVAPTLSAGVAWAATSPLPTVSPATTPAPISAAVTPTSSAGASATAGAAAAPGQPFFNAQVTTVNDIGDPSVTYGGQASRFTFQLTTAKGIDPIHGLTLTFPKGTKLDKINVQVVVLVGLARRPIAAKIDVSGEVLKLGLTPPIEGLSTVKVTVFEVVPVRQGGSYEVKGEWAATGVTGAMPTMPFQTSTPSLTLDIENFLAAQGWVRSWNSVQFLNMFLNPQIFVRSIPLLFVGWLLSIALVAVAYPAAMPIGLALAFMKMSKIGIVRWVSSAYINVIRGTPLFLQIYIAFFALPLAGVRVPEFILGVIVLSLNSSAYMAEIFRAGIQSINKGQFEAASSLGMTYSQAMAFVIIPQTVRRVLPTMTSEFILLFKDTALLSAVGVFELMKFAQGIAANSGNVTPYLEAAAFYLILTIPLINYVGKLEARLALSEGGTGPSPRKPKRGAEALAANDAAADAAGDLPGA
jgi:polar amino acid transport system substrate-binding protein